MSNLLQKKTAILGATGHIAKSLIFGLDKNVGYRLFLFARDEERLNQFVRAHCHGVVNCLPFNQFNDTNYDVVINCIGIGDPAKLKNAGGAIFRLTETFDNMVLDYLERHPDTLYINFSSGAVYGTDFDAAVSDSSYLTLEINNIVPQNYYGISKINAEAKHRGLPQKNIVDLRVFSFFSRFIDSESKFFINEIISCLKTYEILKTGPGNIVRDYIHPEDLLNLVEKCIDKHSLNDVFDVYSLKPVTKFEVLDYFVKQHGLKYYVNDKLFVSTATGTKDCYFSNNKKAEKIGYFPRFTSLQSIIEGSKAIL